MEIPEQFLKSVQSQKYNEDADYYLSTDFTHCFGVSIIDFEQVIAS